MIRLKITAAYNGAAFMGSQQQPTTTQTVIGTLMIALRRLQIDASPVGSGRTDRGVHATHQIFHLDVPDFWDNTTRLREMLNLQLPTALRISRIEIADPDFHARFSAKQRTYRYILKEGESNPFEGDFITFVPKLDTQAIIDAVGAFEGVHDFEYFKKSGSDVKHHTRIMHRAYAYSHQGHFIIVFKANSFLRSQIRLMVGFLLRISEGKSTKEQLIEQLSRVKRHSTDTAPHNGLYLTRISY